MIEKTNCIVEIYLKIILECTRRPECRCPEGYFKTKDGTECLKFSTQPADCTEAERACSADFNSRLAIARDHARLTKIADIMQGKINFLYIVENLLKKSKGKQS